MLRRTGEEKTQLEAALKLRTFTSYLSSRYHLDLQHISRVDRNLFLKFLEHFRRRFLNEHFERPRHLFSPLEHKSRLMILLKSQFDRLSPSLTHWIDRFLELFQAGALREREQFAEKLETLKSTHRSDLESISINHRRQLQEVKDQIEAIDEVCQAEFTEQEQRQQMAIFAETYRSLENSFQGQRDELQKRFVSVKPKSRPFENLQKTCQEQERRIQRSRQHEQLLIKQIRTRQRPLSDSVSSPARFSRMESVHPKRQANSNRIRRLVIQAEQAMNALSRKLANATRLVRYFHLCRRYEGRCQLALLEPSPLLSIDQYLSRFNHRMAEILLDCHTLKEEQRQLKDDQRELNDLLKSQRRC